MINFGKIFRKQNKITDTDSGAAPAPISTNTIPEGMDFVGGQLFDETGEEFLGYFKKFCNLEPSSNVLDVGCGIGRMAIPLTRFLDKNGRYVGFDVVKEGIDWCNENIAKNFQNFSFYHTDIYNKQYNPDGPEKASSYSFPFDSNSFDFVFLTSVFTHMLPDDLENYFSEIARVLKPGGKALITYFILNEESEKLISDGKSHLEIKYDLQTIKVMDLDMPEAATGYTHEQLSSLYSKYGLTIDDPIYWGNWCGRKKHTSFQDIVVSSKDMPARV